MSRPPVYTNRTGRPPGRSVRALGVVLPGIARVRAQAEPYADAWQERTRAAAVAPGRRWVVLGDSMSQAIGATGPDRGWVDQLLGRLGPAGHDLEVVNLSATGARVPDLLDQQLPAWSALPPSRSPLCDLVTVMIGSNDLFSGARHRARLPGAMAELVTRLPSGSVVTTLPQPRAAAQPQLTAMPARDIGRDCQPKPRALPAVAVARRIQPGKGAHRGLQAVVGYSRPVILDHDHDGRGGKLHRYPHLNSVSQRILDKVRNRAAHPVGKDIRFNRDARDPQVAPGRSHRNGFADQ